MSRGDPERRTCATQAGAKGRSRRAQFLNYGTTVSGIIVVDVIDNPRQHRNGSHVAPRLLRLTMWRRTGVAAVPRPAFDDNRAPVASGSNAPYGTEVGMGSGALARKPQPATHPLRRSIS
jgi:hypothetical protein